MIELPRAEELATMSEAQIDELRRRVIQEGERRVVAQRDRAAQQRERQRATEVVREEIRAYLTAGGSPEALHALLNRVVEQLQAQADRQNGAQRPAAGSAGVEGTTTPATPGQGAGGAASG